MKLPKCATLILTAVAACCQSLTLASLKPHKVNLVQVTYKGKPAIRVTDAVDPKLEGNEDRIALVTSASVFHDGAIDVEIAGEPGPGASEGARGFVGIAFRVASDLSKFECFYLRPTNGRVDDQVRRNHSAQYISFPDFPWYRLRKEFPEKYETYADVIPGEWMQVRIEVDGKKARLFVNGVRPPSLIVNDLKLGATVAGSIALWIGPGTVAHFSGLKISSK